MRPLWLQFPNVEPFDDGLAISGVHFQARAARRGEDQVGDDSATAPAKQFHRAAIDEQVQPDSAVRANQRRGVAIREIGRKAGIPGMPPVDEDLLRDGIVPDYGRLAPACADAQPDLCRPR